MSKLPSIPSLSSKVDKDVRRMADALKAWIEALRKSGGVVTDAALATAVAGVVRDLGGAKNNTTSPPAPANLTVSGGFNRIMIGWDDPLDAIVAYAEVYRAEADDFGQAVMIGASFSQQYPDTPPDSSLAKTYWYWARFIGTNDLEGPLNSLSGTPGSTADEPGYLLEIATDKWLADTPAALDDYVLPTRPNGYVYKCTTAGTTGSTEPAWPTTLTQTVGDGFAVWTCEQVFSFERFFKAAIVDGVIKLALKEIFIADETVTSSKIKELVADKLTVPGTASIWDAIITMGKITNAYIDNIIQSTVFDPNTGVGWELDKAGGLDISNLTIREQGTGAVILSSGGTPLDFSRVGGTTKPADNATRNTGALADKNAVDWASEVSNKSGLAAYTQITSANRSALLALKVIGGAYIDDLAVDTLQIQNNAVTVPVSAYLSGATGAIVSGSSPTTEIQNTPSTDFRGAPVAVTVSAAIETFFPAYGSYNDDFYLEILRDTTVIYSAVKVATLEKHTDDTMVYGSFSITINDNPGTGSHRYYAKMSHSSVDTTAKASRRSIVAIGVRK